MSSEIVNGEHDGGFSVLITGHIEDGGFRPKFSVVPYEGTKPTLEILEARAKEDNGPEEILAVAVNVLMKFEEVKYSQV